MLKLYKRITFCAILKNFFMLHKHVKATTGMGREEIAVLGIFFKGYLFFFLLLKVWSRLSFSAQWQCRAGWFTETWLSSLDEACLWLAANLNDSESLSSMDICNLGLNTEVCTKVTWPSTINVCDGSGEMFNGVWCSGERISTVKGARRRRQV